MAALRRAACPNDPLHVTGELFPPVASLSVLLAIVIILAVRRVPLWNPTYFFALAFSGEIALGWFLARILGMQFPSSFAVPVLGAYLLMVLTLFLGTMAMIRPIRLAAARRGILDGIVISYGAGRKLAAFLVGSSALLTLSNLIVTIKWGALPVVAYNRYGQDTIKLVKDAVPGDVAASFMVPGLTANAVHLVNPAIVAYFLLVFMPKLRPRRMRPASGWRSVGWPIHAAMVLLLVDAAIIPQRHIVMVALFTLVLLFVLTGRLRASRVALIGVLGLALQLGLGAARRGGDRYAAAEAIGLPAIAGATIVYEPAIYLASGIPNLYIFWRRSDPHGFGELLISPMLPEFVNQLLGFHGDRAELVRRLSGEGWVLPGETLRTPWFELYYEFGWPGVYLLALAMSAVILVLYRRALRPRGRASVTYFVAAKAILMFAIINNVADRPVLLQFLLGAVLTQIVRTSSVRALRASPRDVLASAGGSALIPG